MAWEHLAIDKPHLAYLIIGGFTTLFMLCSLFVKEKLYIGEATVATICGVIFGPHAANLFSPGSWGNVDRIALECSRIVLVVQCFAVGVELPKSYMERHWKSVSLLLIPVMTFGWLVTSLFIWCMISRLTWLESLACAACVTATDPVLASSVVGKGKFAKRIPKHLRDLLSAESGCNDGMAFPFIYLALYLLKYGSDSKSVAYHWICFTILYECIFGAVYGFLIGYVGRHAIKWADSKDLIDRESFLVFYFVLALFCAGSGSLLGLDDLLVGFAAGVGFSNDGWFTQKTEESHVSNVIDLLLNLAYFVFLGAIIPWGEYNSPELGMTPWRLVVIALLVIFFRRIPVMLALKPIIPDIKNWREALFAGHFGPIGVGAVFAALLTRAELETDSTQPLPELPGPEAKHYALIQVIWPVTSFLVISSIIVHGSSIAVFTLGKRINTLTMTMSYTQGNDDGASWMNRLPRITSTSKSMSKSKTDYESNDSSNEKLPEFPPGTLPPVGFPGNFLRRQKEEDNPSNPNSRPPSIKTSTRRKKRESGMGPGGPISQSAIAPQRRSEPVSTSPSETLNEKSNDSAHDAGEDDTPDGLEMQQVAGKRKDGGQYPSHDVPEIEAYQEGDEMIVEDEEGNVLSVENTRGEPEEQKQQHVIDDAEELERETSGEHAKDKEHPHERNEGEEIRHAVVDGIVHPSHPYRHLKKNLHDWKDWGKHKDKDTASSSASQPHPQPRRGPAHAYQYGNTIIVEDEDGEVVKKYDIPHPEKKRRAGEGTTSTSGPATMRGRLHRMGTWAHITHGPEAGPAEASNAAEGGQGSEDVKRKDKKSAVVDDDDDRVRFTVTSGGRRMSKQDFIQQIQSLDPRARCEVVEESDAPEGVKEDARRHAKAHSEATGTKDSGSRPVQVNRAVTSLHQTQPSSSGEPSRRPEIQRAATHEDRPRGQNGLTLVDSNGEDIPFHPVSDTITKYAAGGPESAAQRRRRLASARKDSDDDGTERVPPSQRHISSHSDRPSPSSAFPPQSSGSNHTTVTRQESSLAAAGETNAERKRRLAALGESAADEAAESDSDDDGGERTVSDSRQSIAEPTVPRRAPGIRFAEGVSTSTGRVQWGEDVGRKAGRRR